MDDLLSAHLLAVDTSSMFARIASRILIRRIYFPLWRRVMILLT
jgi:hypothetical protein